MTCLLQLAEELGRIPLEIGERFLLSAGRELIFSEFPPPD
jgi:hypothetical protein